MHSKVWLKLLLVCFLVTTTIEAKQSTSLTYLNILRTKSGLIPFSTNKALTRAASSHAKYLTRQQSNGHYEKQGYKGFTGKTPTDRTLKSGYISKMVMENLSINAKDSHDAIDNLMSAIYHRFVFLSTEKDEIGEGFSRRNRSAVKTAYVYNLGTSSLRRLCKEHFEIIPNVQYVNNICQITAKVVPYAAYLEKQNDIRRKNAKIIFYPYNGQINVPPAFFIEHPHPLPGSKVSGYPVSVQFNEAYFKNIKLNSFRLFDVKGTEVKKRKILTLLNDKNHKLTKYQFAFMPLKRLEYATTYRAEFEAVADGKKVKKSWSFSTEKPQGVVYKITKKTTTIKAGKARKIVLYFEPRSRDDVLEGMHYTDDLQVEYLDANTFRITLPKKISRQGYRVKTNDRTVNIK